ncbi:zinc finger protein [Macleaya cordata]|uniref:Zinc finger protein n=1 Tax=Macleaya cordata TaxID=56857 RepID=A0A200PRB5_MACCD|nr:zinc finger protein [Macleaya cordata]
MDYNGPAEMQQHPPNPNPNPAIDPYAQFHNPQSSSTYPHYSYYPPHQTQNPNPNPTHTDPQTSLELHGAVPVPVPSAQLDASLQPPGVDPYTYHPHLAGYDAQTAAALYHQQIQNWAAATFYSDASATAPTGTEPSVPANLNSAQWTNPVVRHYMNGVAIKKGLMKIKKTKIVQSAYCEVCKIDCNSRDVLDQHKLGKKHKKNLEKLEEAKQNANPPAPTPVAVAPPLVVTNSIIGPPENPGKKKKAAPSSASKEDLESKRRKLMEGGAAAEAVRVCTICNVACNSQTVFDYHLAGQKHASMVKKLAA